MRISLQVFGCLLPVCSSDCRIWGRQSLERGSSQVLMQALRMVPDVVPKAPVAFVMMPGHVDSRDWWSVFAV